MNKITITNESLSAIHTNFCDEIVALFRSGFAPAIISKRLRAYHEKDIALALPLLEKEERIRLFHALPSKKLAAVLECSDNSVDYFSLLSVRQRADVLSCMEVSDAAELLSRLTGAQRSALLDLLEPDVRREIELIRSFSADEIGGRMSTNFVSIPDTASVKEAMSELIRQAADNDNVSTLYLVNQSGVFCGVVDLKDLIVAREGTPLSAITTVSYPYLHARSSVEDCIPLLSNYAEASIPVLDNENKLLGVVTAQDFAEILDDELGDDYAKLGGLSAEEDLAEPVVQSVKKRMPWLCVLLALGLGVSATVGLFESIVAQLPIVMCFQSLILDMAGNVGTQSLAVAIRVLMDAQIGRKQKRTLVQKEARVGLTNGCILGVLSFAAIGGYLCLIDNAPLFSFAVSGCLGLAMALAMVVSSLTGVLIPIFFMRVGVDPAVASGPLITTVNDLTAVVSYYGLSWLILLNLLRL